MRNNKYSVSALIISSLFLFLLTACAELDSHSAFNRFQKAEDLYRASLRWGEWTTVLQLIRPRPEETGGKKVAMGGLESSTGSESSTGQESSTRQESSTGEESSTNQESQSRFEEYLNHLNTIKVSSTEVLSSAMNKADGTGESRLLVDYRFDTSARVHSIRYTVFWWYDKKSNTWFTDTPLPKEFDLPKHRTIKLSPKRY